MYMNVNMDMGLVMDTNIDIKYYQTGELGRNYAKLRVHRQRN